MAEKAHPWIVVISRDEGEEHLRCRIVMNRCDRRPRSSADLIAFLEQAKIDIAQNFGKVEIIWQDPEPKHTLREIRNAITKNKPSGETKAGPEGPKS